MILKIRSWNFLRIIAEKDKVIENTENTYWGDMYLCPDDAIKENYF